MSQKAVKNIIDEIIEEVLTEREYLTKIFKALDSKLKNPSESEVITYLTDIGVPFKAAKDITSQYMATKNEEVEPDLEEMTNSAAIQGYNIPGAFSGNGSRKKKDDDDARIAHGTVAKQIHSWVDNIHEGVGHAITDDGSVYVDSDFVNNAKDVLPNSELKHAGMGDFYLQTPDGNIEFDRIGDKKPGMVGRTHIMKDRKGGKLVAQLLTTMVKQNKAKVLKENSVTESASDPQVISDLRDIVKRRQYGKVTDPTSGRKVAVDTFSASAIVQVYDAINDANKSKYVQLPIRKMADTAFKLINKNESVNEATYREFKRDESLTPRQKIGLKIKEINGSLYRIETAIRQASKLKMERDVTPENYWDSTHKKMNKISERILKIARELREMK